MSFPFSRPLAASCCVPSLGNACATWISLRTGATDCGSYSAVLFLMDVTTGLSLEIKSSHPLSFCMVVFVYKNLSFPHSELFLRNRTSQVFRYFIRAVRTSSTLPSGCLEWRQVLLVRGIFLLLMWFYNVNVLKDAAPGCKQKWP